MATLSVARRRREGRSPRGVLAVGLLLWLGLSFPGTPVSGQTEKLHTEAGVESLVRDLPCPSSLPVAQLRGRIPVQQYVGEPHASALREVFIEGVFAKTCRAPRPTGKWQVGYHSAVIRSGSSYALEYGNRALGGIVNVHKTRVQGAQETRLENLQAPWAPDSYVVAVTGRFIRPGGDLDNVHIYHFVHRNTVNWLLVQAVSPQLPVTTVPDPDGW